MEQVKKKKSVWKTITVSIIFLLLLVFLLEMGSVFIQRSQSGNEVHTEHFFERNKNQIARK
ncbi:hypothetical protein [Companilactobacillus furfuricola]|uniref:hypothetical protein n=1 Tax=Companilactobacillus furfuricola TaxID=1462575 RepID=UPI000F768A78|nr:hypothetical protein [Companilactobacillus furfuricola]